MILNTKISHKFIITIIALCLIIAALTGCSDSGANSRTKNNEFTGSSKELVIATIGSINYDYLVNKFNAENELGIKVRVEDYRLGTTREAAIQRLNMELVSGKGPDLIDFEAFPYREIYSNQGFLENLAPIMEKEIVKDDFFILEKNKSDKIYFIPSSFSIITCYGLSSVFQGQNSWSFDQFQSLLTRYSYQFPTLESRIDFLNNACISMIPNCVNWENSTCSFNSKEFQDLLALTTMLEKTPSILDSTPQELLLSGSVPYLHTWIYSPLDIKEREEVLGSDLTYIGFPTADGSSGSYVYLSMLTAINKSSTNKEYALEFIRFMLDDDFQRSVAANMILIKKSICDELIDELQNPFAKYEGRDVEIHSDGSFTVDGVYMDQIYDPTPLISDRQVDKFYGLIRNANTLYDYDPNIYSIIEQETSRLFHNVYTVEETSEKIQNRVSIYVSEQS